MRITGAKRWFVVALCALMAGIMVYVPFLRYSYYDQMCVLFTQYKQVVPADSVNGFIGDFGMAFGIVSMLGYPFGGIFADRFSEKWLLIAGGVLMGVCSFWFGIVPGKTSRRPSGLRKTRVSYNSLAHRTTWLRSDLTYYEVY